MGEKSKKVLCNKSNEISEKELGNIVGGSIFDKIKELFKKKGDSNKSIDWSKLFSTNLSENNNANKLKNEKANNSKIL